MSETAKNKRALESKERELGIKGSTKYWSHGGGPVAARHHLFIAKNNEKAKMSQRETKSNERERRKENNKAKVWLMMHVDCSSGYTVNAEAEF